ncbi:MAG: heme b synthase [Spirochaetes bacterium RBG_16_49_21]|nr:MAG: heme b synthase [Spirochaetes bacterium RBG_16_49_21]
MNMKHVPRLIFWELTKQCNLACIHCRAEARDDISEDELTLDEIRSVIDDIAFFYKPILIMTGGEPLYRDDIFEIASYASGKGLKTALATNGTLIDELAAQRIKQSGIERVSISLDGKNSSSHDDFRGIPGSFDRALQGVARLRQEGVPFQVNTTVTKRNAEEISGILDMAESLGACALHLFMLVPVGCGVEIAESEMISKEEYERVLNWFYDKSKTTRLELKATCAPHYYRIIRQRARKEGKRLLFETDGLSAMTRGCLAGTGVCFISHRGEVQPCGYLPVAAGNVLVKPFHEIWESSPEFESLRDPDRLTGACGICEYKKICGGCRARAFYASGDFLSEEPSCAYTPARMKK